MFTLGKCSDGDNCEFRHPENLKPDVLDKPSWEPLVVAAAPLSAAFANFPPALETRPWLEGWGGTTTPASTMTWSYIDQKWTWTTEWSSTPMPGEYSSGPLPSSLEFLPEPHAQSGEAVSATWSYVRRRWKIIWADDFSMESARFRDNTQSSSGSEQKRPQEEQPKSQPGTAGTQPQTLPQLPSQSVQQASITKNDDLADEHRNKKFFRPDKISIESSSDEDERFGADDDDIESMYE